MELLRGLTVILRSIFYFKALRSIHTPSFSISMSTPGVPLGWPKEGVLCAVAQRERESGEGGGRGESTRRHERTLKRERVGARVE